MKNKKLVLSLVAFVAVVAVLVGVYFATRPETQQGSKTITVTVVHKDKTEKVFTYHTDEEKLDKVLLAEGLIEGYTDTYGFVVEEVDGDDVLNRLVVKNVKTGEETVIHADPDEGMFGIFCFIGMNPNSQLFEGQLPLEKGYIRTDEDMRTPIPGVFAAGDIRVKSLRQVVTAVADGAIAAMQAEKYLAEQE